MIRFVRLQAKHLEMVMGWRLKPEVARHMFTAIEHDLEKQRRWFRIISGDDSYRYWIVLYKDIPIGVVNLAAIDRVNRRCSAGYYIGELEYRNLGALIPPYLYNYVFKVMGLERFMARSSRKMLRFLKYMRCTDTGRLGCAGIIFLKTDIFMMLS